MSGASVRFEIFPFDLDATTDFYTRVLGFSLAADQRDDLQTYLAVQRDGVRIGATGRQDQGHRQPPTGVELVLEVDDLVDELDRVQRADWPLVEVCHFHLMLPAARPLVPFSLRHWTSGARDVDCWSGGNTSRAVR